MLEIADVKNYIGYIFMKQAEAKRNGGPTYKEFNLKVRNCRKRNGRTLDFCKKKCNQFPCWA